jgi:hypothetical protein
MDRKENRARYCAGKTMIYPPGQGKSGEHLMQLWRTYLEQYADSEGDVEGQIVVGAYSAVEVFVALCRTLDKSARYKQIIDEWAAFFSEAKKQAADFADRILNATFSLYNSLNILAHQFTEENQQAAALIARVDEQVHLSTESGSQVERSAAALRACFPLLSLLSITLDEDGLMTGTIRQIEQRFAAGAAAASSEWERVLNALYRMVEMVQIFALLTDADLKDQINQIASRFKDEDQMKELSLKLRNGFCRLFELGHILVMHVDAML